MSSTSSRRSSIVTSFIFLSCFNVAIVSSSFWLSSCNSFINFCASAIFAFSCSCFAIKSCSFSFSIFFHYLFIPLFFLLSLFCSIFSFKTRLFSRMQFIFVFNVSLKNLFTTHPKTLISYINDSIIFAFIAAGNFPFIIFSIASCVFCISPLKSCLCTTSFVSLWLISSNCLISSAVY